MQRVAPPCDLLAANGCFCLLTSWGIVRTVRASGPAIGSSVGEGISMRYVSLWGVSATLALLVSLTLSYAEDTRRKWQFGVGYSYWSTDDNIRSNSTTAYA